MDLEYANRKKQPYYLQIYNMILEQIQAGRYGEGAKLPTEKELADQFQVSRITSKKALDILESEGIITRTPGKGSFIRQIPGKPAEGPQPPEKTRPLVGVVMEKITPSFGGELLMGLEHGCARHGYSMLLKLTYGDQEAEERAVKQLLEAGVDGIVILCVYNETYNAQILKLAYEQFPVVLVDRKLYGMPLPYVGTEHATAARELTDELYREGYGRIGFITANTAFSTTSIIQRYNGYVESCTHHGQVVEDHQRFSGLLNHQTPELWEEQFDANVSICLDHMRMHEDLDAFLVTSYDYAVIVEEAAYQMGKETGRHYGVATFDFPETQPRYKKFMHIRQGQWKMGDTAVELLHKKRNGEEIPSDVHIPYRLVK